MLFTQLLGKPNLSLLLNTKNPRSSSIKDTVIVSKHEWWHRRKTTYLLDNLGGFLSPLGTYKHSISGGSIINTSDTMHTNWDNYVSSQTSKLNFPDQKPPFITMWIRCSLPPPWASLQSVNQDRNRGPLLQHYPLSI